MTEESEALSYATSIVEYRREGNENHLFSMGSAAFQDIRIDLTAIPEEQRGGIGGRFLCAAALYCFSNTLASELIARGATIKPMTCRAAPEKAQDDYYRTKITRIRMEVDVDVDDADLPALEECREIMRRGSLITYSLNEGIEVEPVIRRVVGGA